MDLQAATDFAKNATNDLLSHADDYRLIIILIIAVVVAFWGSRFVAQSIIFFAQRVALWTDTETREDRVVILRQVETYLSVTVAIVRALVVALVAYITWKVLTYLEIVDSSAFGAAAIGASAFVVVFTGATLGILLRDITAGATMIIEKWFTIGDYIKVEPFAEMSGVVERMTLRSTRLRNLNGEVVWVHNQQIQAVHVTPRGVHTMAVDIFVHDPKKGEEQIKKIAQAIPTGPTMLARPLRIKESEKWGDDLWRITVTGDVTPGRDWLIDTFFVNALKEIDEDKKKNDRLMVYEPIARYADPIADKRFRRAVQLHRDRSANKK